MSRLLGAAAILLACFRAAQLRLEGKKERIRLLRALSESLLALRGELCERQKNLGGIFSHLAHSGAERAVGDFYGRLCESLRELGERGFAELWNAAVGASFCARDEFVRDALSPLGACLGGSELDRQCAELAKAAQKLADEAVSEREALRSERRLCLGLSLSAGAFLVIILM